MFVKKFTLLFVFTLILGVLHAQLPDMWTDDSGIDVFQEMATVHGGDYSCGVIVNTDVQGECDLSNEVAIVVSEGDDLKVSFWAFTSEHVRITCALDWVGASTTWTQVYIGPATVGWEQFVFEGSVPVGATEVNIRLRFYDVAGFTPPQTQFVDDVEFESPIGESILLANGDFESWPGLNPEPSNYPNDFTAIAIGLSANLEWTDATGAQLPDTYLVLASTSQTIDPPEDGIYVANDLDLSDGMGAANVAFGEETFSFTDLLSSTNYYFAIYPYTNSGTNTDYKNDGTAPAAMVQTSSVTILNEENFDFGWGDWTPISVLGDQLWDRENTYGIGGSPCAKMSGYEGGDFPNEDWLISPALDFSIVINAVFTFWSAMGYPIEVHQLTVKISTDYDGGGDPTSASWTELDPILASGDPFWEWTYSGEVDISGFSGEVVYLAFVYLSDGSDSETWEIDNIVVTGEVEVGIENTDQYITSLYPNPSNGTFNVQLSEEFDLLEVYSITGQMIYSNEISGLNVSVNLSDPGQGMYFVKLTNQDSGFGISKRVIIR